MKDGIPVCDEVKEQNSPCIASDGAGGAIVVWEDFRDGSSAEVYYKRNPNGNPNGITQISSNIPEGFSLSQNYPNPFNPSTSIRFRLAEDGDISLRVYDLRGGLVEEVASGSFPAGEHAIAWTPRNIASGAYLYRLRTGGASLVRKLLYVR